MAWGRMPDGRKKSGTNTAPLLSERVPSWPFSEMMCVQVTANCSHAPLNQKSKPMQAPCEPTTRISYGSFGQRWWLGDNRASRADPTSHSAASPGC